MPTADGRFLGISVPWLPPSMEKPTKREVQALRNIAEITAAGQREHIDWLNSDEHAALIDAAKGDGPGATYGPGYPD